MVEQRTLDDSIPGGAEYKPVTPMESLYFEGGAAELAEMEANGTHVVEEKYDGNRMQAIVRMGVPRLFGRNEGVKGTKVEKTDLCEEIVEGLRGLPDIHLDGEVMCDRPDLPRNKKFTALAGRVRSYSEHAKYRRECPLIYVVYDIITDEPLTYEERREILENMFFRENKLGPSIRLSEVWKDHFLEHYYEVVNGGGEGLMLKLKNGLYHVAKRTADWMKVVPERNMDVVAIGLEPGTGRREKWFGAIRARVPNTNLTFKIGTGYDDAVLEEITNRVKTGDLKFPVMIEIGYKDLYPSGTPRMPVYHRLREDKQVNGI